MSVESVLAIIELGLNFEKMGHTNCSKSDLTVALKMRRSPRFKAGSELSSKVNHVAVEFNEDLTDDAELMEIKINLTSEACVLGVELN